VAVRWNLLEQFISGDSIFVWLGHMTFGSRVIWRSEVVNIRVSGPVATDQPASGRTGRDCGWFGVIGIPHILVGDLRGTITEFNSIRVWLLRVRAQCFSSILNP